VALQNVQAGTILHHQAVVALREASFRLGVLPGFSSIALHNLLCATGDGFRSLVICPLRATPGASCTFRCGLLFGLRSFLFSSQVPLPGVFPYFIYLLPPVQMYQVKPYNAL
jgi:hypothetical protein